MWRFSVVVEVGRPKTINYKDIFEKMRIATGINPNVKLRPDDDEDVTGKDAFGV